MKTFLTMLDRWTDRLDIGGWLLLFCGALLVGSLILVPEWLKNHDYQQHRDRLRHQLHQAQHQHEQAESMLTAFEQADPSLLKRLAWHELRLQPTDVEPLTAIAPPQSLTDPTRSMIRRWTLASSDVDAASPTALYSPLPEASSLSSVLTHTEAGATPQRVSYTHQEALPWLRPIFGKPRPWTLAFGGWLFLMSLVLTPSKKESTTQPAA